jgi:hypothetical protein
MAKILSNAEGLYAVQHDTGPGQLIRKFNTWPILAESLVNTV